jgi:hypothetical protein
MWYCLVKSRSGKSFTTFGGFQSEGEAIHTGQMACVRSGGEQYYTVEIPDRTAQDKIKSKINYQMFEKYQIQLDDIRKRHFKGKCL